MGLERTAAGQPTPQPARFLAPAVAPDARWLEGNTHTHTTNSDGDTAPVQVARWYKSTRYNFLVLSEFFWSIDTAALFRVKNDRLPEIFNGHPTVHNIGGGD